MHVANYVAIARRTLARWQEPDPTPATWEHAPQGKVFPRCPRCASYDLYRPNNIGDYECLTCGLRNIAEAVARRTH
jgi:hypothetical protein